MKAINREGDMVTIYPPNEDGDYPISFTNAEEGYAGATIIPKEMIQQITTPTPSEESENA